MDESQCRQNYHSDCEAGINKQINLELYASYVYHSMAIHFDRDDVALHRVSKYFAHQSEEERGHADKFMKYQNMRGGRVKLQDIMKPEKDVWGAPVDALKSALKLERDVNQSLLDLHSKSEEHGDKHLCDYLENHFLDEQVESIKEIGDLITNATRCGTGLGEFLFDKHAFKDE